MGLHFIGFEFLADAAKASSCTYKITAVSKVTSPSKSLINQHRFPQFLLFSLCCIVWL